MPLSWPAGLPYEPLRDGFKIPSLGLAAMKSPMQSGKVRYRPQFTLRITPMEMALPLSQAEHAVFRQFIIVQLGEGTGEFLMPVWIAQTRTYETRLVQIRDAAEGVSEEPFATDQVLVGFTLDVRNL